MAKEKKMENFQFNANTQIFFGKGQISNLPNEIKKYGKKVLLVYGGGSIKKIGLYDTVVNLLKDSEIYELSGVEPNPKIESVRAGVKLCKEHSIEVVLAVGGGSVIDCAKIISAATFCEEDAWEMIKKSIKTEKALPIITVLTLSATGSEYDAGAIIANKSENEKLGYESELIRPKASILDPEYTFTVSAYQTAAGSVDIISHILEQYFVPYSPFLADKLCEAVLKTVIKYLPKAIENPEDYEARGQLMWASSIADNGILSLGSRITAFSCHGIEHELNAYYNTTHGVGLAIITIRWMRYILSEKSNEEIIERFANYGINVWDIDSNLEKLEIAKKSIDLTEKFFKSLGIPMSLTELKIGEEHFEEMASNSVKYGFLEYAFVPLNKEDVIKILKMCL